MQSQALYDVLKDRRSFNLRDPGPDPVDATCLEQMLEAANWAPSHERTEPWRFTVFVGEARRRLGAVLAEAYRLSTPAERFDAAAMAFTRDRVLLAPAGISIGMEPDAMKHMPEWEEISAVAMAVHNIHLMACSRAWAASGAVASQPASARGAVPGIATAHTTPRLPLRGHTGHSLAQWPAPSHD